jgi:1-acyl-sn-glycerol-3-phosphate acyltransferase
MQETVVNRKDHQEAQAQAVRGHLGAQLFLGFLSYFLFVLPYARRIRGLARVSRAHRIFVCNHVSLLDTILLGGIFWSRGRLPILVLGDSHVWMGSGLKRLLSSRVGFLIERRKTDRSLVEQLEIYGASSANFNLIMFPEGTRGDGLTVGMCQSGIYTVAQAARVPIVPIYISGMQKVSTKTSPFRALRGLRQVEVEFGEEIAPEEYLAMEREAFRARVHRGLQDLSPANSPSSLV